MPSGLVVTDTGIQRMLRLIQINMNTGTGMTLRLFVNDHHPAESDVLANYTEASFPGYAPVTINHWGAATVLNHIAAINHPQALFQLSGVGPFPVYGYYVTFSVSQLWWAQRDPAAPVQLVNPGDTYPITPLLTMISQYSS
jgi:hypothetical protein